MITTRLYALHAPDTQWDIVHLFEHLVIRGFFEYIESRGYAPSLIGWVNGETFEDIMYIQAGLYDRRVAKYLDEYIKKLPEFASTDIEKSIAMLEAEEKVILRYDARELLDAVNDLSKRPWNKEVTSKETAKHIITSAKKASEFTDLTVTLHSSNFTYAEKKLFQRTSVLLVDILDEYIRDTYPSYTVGGSVVRDAGKALGFMTIYTVRKKSVTATSLKTALSDYLNSFDVRRNKRQIALHFNTFANEPLWLGSSIDYYRNANVLTTPKEIKKLATTKNLKSLFGKLEVSVHVSRPADKTYID